MRDWAQSGASLCILVTAAIWICEVLKDRWNISLHLEDVLYYHLLSLQLFHGCLRLNLNRASLGTTSCLIQCLKLSVGLYSKRRCLCWFEARCDSHRWLLNVKPVQIFVSNCLVTWHIFEPSCRCSYVFGHQCTRFSISGRRRGGKYWHLILLLVEVVIKILVFIILFNRYNARLLSVHAIIVSRNILEVVNCATFNDNASILHQTVPTFLVFGVYDATTHGLDTWLGEKVAFVSIVSHKTLRHGRCRVKRKASFVIDSRVYRWDLFAAKLVEDVRLPLEEVSVSGLRWGHHILLVFPELLLLQLD